MSSISSTDDFEFYTVNLPDGSSRTFSDFHAFDAFCDYLQHRADLLSYLDSLVISPTSISVAIAEVLGLSPSKVLPLF